MLRVVDERSGMNNDDGSVYVLVEDAGCIVGRVRNRNLYVTVVEMSRQYSN